MGVRDEYAPRFGRQVLTIWEGSFSSSYVGEAWELPRHNGYMVTLDHLLWTESLRVECESPRTDENWTRVDDVILSAIRDHRERAS